jgi:propanol-preferring alcohol dehydrogenase
VAGVVEALGPRTARFALGERIGAAWLGRTDDSCRFCRRGDGNLCAGIIGYRALRCAAVPPGGRLGIYGFGGSAHLTAQVALAQGIRVHGLTRGERNRPLATALGVDSVGGAGDPAPEPLDGVILSRRPVSWYR